MFSSRPYSSLARRHRRVRSSWSALWPSVGVARRGRSPTFAQPSQSPKAARATELAAGRAKNPRCPDRCLSQCGARPRHGHMVLDVSPSDRDGWEKVGRRHKNCVLVPLGLSGYPAAVTVRVLFLTEVTTSGIQQVTKRTVFFPLAHFISAAQSKRNNARSCRRGGGAEKGPAEAGREACEKGRGQECRHRRVVQEVRQEVRAAVANKAQLPPASSAAHR